MKEKNQTREGFRTENKYRRMIINKKGNRKKVNKSDFRQSENEQWVSFKRTGTHSDFGSNFLTSLLQQNQ
jgi:hypothetical protein